jgi:hypothetical protein
VHGFLFLSAASEKKYFSRGKGGRNMKKRNTDERQNDFCERRG